MLEYILSVKTKNRPAVASGRINDSQIRRLFGCSVALSYVDSGIAAEFTE